MDISDKYKKGEAEVMFQVRDLKYSDVVETTLGLG